MPRLILIQLVHFSLLCPLGKEKEVLAVEDGGNSKVNAVFEARPQGASHVPPTVAQVPVAWHPKDADAEDLEMVELINRRNKHREEKEARKEAVKKAAEEYKKAKKAAEEYLVSF